MGLIIIYCLTECRDVPAHESRASRGDGNARAIWSCFAGGDNELGHKRNDTRRDITLYRQRGSLLNQEIDGPR